LLSELIPRARQGLLDAGIDPDDVTRYLDVVEERTKSAVTGARWMLRSLAGMEEGEVGGERQAADVRLQALTAAMLEGQRKGDPVHQWPLARVGNDSHSWRASFATVGQIMSTDLFTVRAGDIIDLAANLMDWRRVRHVPVEDEAHQLVGIVSHRALLRVVARGLAQGEDEEPLLVKSVMVEDPITATPETPTVEAIRSMREHRVSCLPVLGPDGTLVGIVTESDLIAVSARLLEEFLSDEE
jgi:CBS domain-containing protein